MPRIPDVARLPRKGFSESGEVVQLGRTNIADAYGGLSSALGDIGRGISDIQKGQDRKDRRAYTKAMTTYQTKQISQSNSYRDDPEYETFDQRFTDEMSKTQSELAETISNPQMREDFMGQTGLKMAQGKEHVKTVAWGKEVDYENASDSVQFDDLREAYINAGTNEDTQGVIDQAIALNESSIESGYVDADAAKVRMKRWQTDAAKGRLSTLPPEDQIKALKEPWAKNIPTDDRMEIERQAKTRIRANKAMVVVDDMMSKEMDLDEGLAHIEKKYKGDDRKAIEARFKHDLALDEKVKAKEQSDTFNKWHLAIGPGGESTIDDVIASEDWESMTPGQRENLTRTSAQKATPRKVSDPWLEIQLSQEASTAQRTGDWTKYHTLFSENSNKLTDADKVTYGKELVEGQAPPELNSKISDAQSVRALLGSDYKPEKAAAILQSLGKWRMQNQEKGKDPDDKDRDAFLYSEALKYDTTPGGHPLNITTWGGEKPVSEMNPEERKVVLDDMREKDTDLYQNVLRQFKGMRIEPSDAQIMEAYTAFESMNGTE